MFSLQVTCAGGHNQLKQQDTPICVMSLQQLTDNREMPGVQEVTGNMV